MPSARPWVPILCTILLACGGRVALSSTDGGPDGHQGTGGSSGGSSSGIGGSSSSSGIGGSSSTSGSGGSSGSFGSSSGTTSGSSSGTTVDDAGLPSGGMCPDDSPVMLLPYAPVTPQKGACTAADITAFEAACGDQATATTCNNWITANLAGPDGGGGTACGNCILPANAPTTQGAGYVTCDGQQNCDFAPNYEGCVQLVDATHGPACAAAWDAVNQCEGWQCNDCASSSAYTACQTSVDQGICQSYEQPFQKACVTDLADGGAATKTCEPGGGTTQNPDWTFIINLICGAGG